MATATARLRPAPAPLPSVRVSSNDESFDAAGAPLTRAQIGGRLSLADRRPLEIAAERGLIVRVGSGSIWTGQPGDRQYRLSTAGECLVVDRAAPLIVRAAQRCEIEVDWPLHPGERLSPGLEPVSSVA